MPNELRVFQNFLGGSIENNPLLATDTTLTSAALTAAVEIGPTQHMPLVLDPQGTAGAPEIVWITEHIPSASATILRGQEGTTARQHAVGTPWVHSNTALDLVPKASGGTKEYAPFTDEIILYADEFTGNAIDPAWTRVDSTGGEARNSWTQKAGVMSTYNTGGDLGGEAHALMRPIEFSLGQYPIYFETCVRYFQQSINYQMLGIYLANGLNYSSSIGIWQMPYNTQTPSGTSNYQSQIQTDIRTRNHYGTDGGGYQVGKTMGHVGSRLFMRTVFMGPNSFKGQISPDGVSWMDIGAAGGHSSGLVPTHMGIAHSTWGATTAYPAIGTFEYFRVYR